MDPVCCGVPFDSARRGIVCGCVGPIITRQAFILSPPLQQTHITPKQSLVRFAREQALPGLEQSASDDRALLLEVGTQCSIYVCVLLLFNQPSRAT